MALVPDIQDIESFGGSCDQSSSCLDIQNQRNDHGARKEHSLSSSFQKDEFYEQIVPQLQGSDRNKNPNLPGDTIMQISGDSAPSQGPNLISDDNGNEAASALSLSMSRSRVLKAEPILSMRLPSVRINNSSSGVPTNFRPQNGGNSRPVFKFRSSSGPGQADRITLNNHSGHFNSASSTSLSLSRSNPPHTDFREHRVLRTRVGQHANSDLLPTLHTNISTARPQGNCYSGISQHNYLLLNSSTTMNVPVQHFGPHQSVGPTWLNEFSVHSSTPYMPGMMLPPHLSRNTPSLSPTFRPNSMADISTLRQQAPEIRNLSQQSRPPNLAFENFGSLGDLSTYEMDYWPALPWAQPTYSAVRQQTAAEHLPWFLSPWHGSQSGSQYFEFAPRLHPNAYGYPPDLLLQPGPRAVGYSPYFHGPLVSQSGHDLRRLGAVPLTSQTVAARADGLQRRPNAAVLRELENETISEDLSFYGRYQHPMMRYFNERFGDMRDDVYDTIRHPIIYYLDERFRDRRQNLENMLREVTKKPYYFPCHKFCGVISSEIECLICTRRLSQVSVRIRSVGRSGLREETIMELLRRKVYDRGTSEPSADPEACCICIGEYVAGEEIGTLNCGHEFHPECIKQWLMVKNQCPFCKARGLDT